MTTLTRYTRRDPFFADFDTLVRSAFGSTAQTTGFSPAVETVRDGDDAVVRVELPGVDVENDVSVEIVEGRLVISGERRDERADEQRRAREIRYGSFKRSFTLPSQVDADAISASYTDGILSVRVAGVYAGTEPKRIEITRS
ncbi:Hsp20/alpha crystallin family protein [Aeromicrobium terrae]|uniref:Hsp20/alpha crystallin family protein n=1 Tax=Aeromicrobium terrae TaxID=2498846 RepID=A0A5C8NKW0_9ACTN|nr:Hsp20/alpha crystallin family protein [Aeromicrobium terrae]